MQPVTQDALRFILENTPACNPRGRDSSRSLPPSWLCHLSAISPWNVKAAVITTLVGTNAKQEHATYPETRQETDHR